MRKHQSGFTLIELVIIIVILGILAAVAIPRYVDLTSQAESATCDGIRGALASTAAILIADGTPGSPATTPAIASGTIQDGWQIGTAGASSCSFPIDIGSNGTTECTVTIDSSLASDC